MEGKKKVLFWISMIFTVIAIVGFLIVDWMYYIAGVDYVTLNSMFIAHVPSYCGFIAFGTYLVWLKPDDD